MEGRGKRPGDKDKRHRWRGDIWWSEAGGGRHGDVELKDSVPLNSQKNCQWLPTPEQKEAAKDLSFLSIGLWEEPQWDLYLASSH